MTHVLRIAHLRIAHQVANPEVGKREGNHDDRVIIMMESRLKHPTELALFRLRG